MDRGDRQVTAATNEKAGGAVALFVPRDPERFLPTVRSLVRNVQLPIVVGAPIPAMLDTFAGFPVERIAVSSLAAMA